MTAVVVANTFGTGDPPSNIPLRHDNTPYRYEMIFDGGKSRAYADTADELLGVLITGYETMSQDQQLVARIEHAVRTQATLQARINAAHDLSQCSPDELVVLRGHRNTPPEVEVWTCPVPLVLVDVFYKPIGNLPRPSSGIVDVEQPPNLLWLSPTEPYDFLVSLHEAEVIILNEHMDARA